MMDERVTCRHYSDLSFGHCSVGISYSMVCKAGESDDDTLFPCFSHHGVSNRCEHAEFPVPGEELTARQLEGELIIMLEVMADFLDNDICPFCNQTIESKQKEGYCLHIYPCGCRLGPGQTAEAVQIAERPGSAGILAGKTA